MLHRRLAQAVAARFGGGGHPGAVGFRFSQAEVPDIGQKADQIVAAVEAILGQVLPAEG